MIVLFNIKSVLIVSHHFGTCIQCSCIKQCFDNLKIAVSSMKMTADPLTTLLIVDTKQKWVSDFESSDLLTICSPDWIRIVQDYP